MALEEEKEREAALVEAREASRKAVEEATLLREWAMTVEEAASKARDEASTYKNAAADLDREKGLLLLTPFLGTCLGWQNKVAVRCLQSGLPMRMVADEGEVECD